MNKKSLLLALAVLVGFFGCKKFEDFSNADVVGDAEYAIPLVKAKTTMEDLLDNFDDNTTVTIDPDGLIRLKYSGEVATRTSAEIFADVQNTLLPVPFLITDTLMALPFSSPAEMEIDFATFKAAELNYFFFSDHEEDVDVKITFPQVTKDGVPLTLIHHIDYPSILHPIPVHLSTEAVAVDLAGYDLFPVDGELFIHYEAVRESGIRDTLHNFFIQLKDPDFTYVEGYLGNQIHPGERDTIYIDFFENWIEGEVQFEDPKIFVNVENSFGIPTRSVIQIFDIHTATGETLVLDADELDIDNNEGIDFVYPELNEVGVAKSMVFTFNKDNSNIVEVLGSQPVALDYLVDALTNPDTLVGVRGFLTDSSFYRVQIEVELPTWGSASGFAAIDTFEVDFGGYGDVTNAEFKFITENDLPLDIGIQVYFADNAGVVLDSLFSDTQEKLVEAAPVDAEGIVTETLKKEIFSTYTAEQFNKIRTATHIHLHADFSTSNNGQIPVKIFSDQEVQFKMGMKIGTEQ